LAFSFQGVIQDGLFGIFTHILFILSTFSA